VQMILSVNIPAQSGRCRGKCRSLDSKMSQERDHVVGLLLVTQRPIDVGGSAAALHMEGDDHSIPFEHSELGSSRDASVFRSGSRRRSLKRIGLRPGSNNCQAEARCNDDLDDHRPDKKVSIGIHRQH